MGMRRGNSKLAKTGRSWDNSRSGMERETSIQVYTDGSKQEQGVVPGAVIFKGSEMIAKLQFKLDNWCSNNQAEQFAILKALEKLEVLTTQSINPLSTTIFTDSRITLDLYLVQKFVSSVYFISILLHLYLLIPIIWRKTLSESTTWNNIRS